MNMLDNKFQRRMEGDVSRLTKSINKHIDLKAEATAKRAAAAAKVEAAKARLAEADRDLGVLERQRKKLKDEFEEIVTLLLAQSKRFEGEIAEAMLAYNNADHSERAQMLRAGELADTREKMMLYENIQEIFLQKLPALYILVFGEDTENHRLLE